jgi:hypothetical protein
VAHYFLDDVSGGQSAQCDAAGEAERVLVDAGIGGVIVVASVRGVIVGQRALACRLGGLGGGEGFCGGNVFL